MLRADTYKYVLLTLDTSSYRIVDGKAVISDRNKDDYLSECTTMSSLCLRIIDHNFTLKYKLNLLEEKGTAVIADRLCTHYYGSIAYYGEANDIDIYVDDATGIVLKYIYHIDYEIGSEIISVSQGAGQLLLP